MRVFQRDNGQCQYCGGEVAYDTFHVDHVHPWYQGGLTTIRNLVTSRLSCNKLKGSQVIPPELRPVAGHGKSAKTPSDPPLNIKPGKYVCTYCSGTFHKQADLDKHRRAR